MGALTEKGRHTFTAKEPRNYHVLFPPDFKNTPVPFPFWGSIRFTSPARTAGRGGREGGVAGGGGVRGGVSSLIRNARMGFVVEWWDGRPHMGASLAGGLMSFPSSGWWVLPCFPTLSLPGLDCVLCRQAGTQNNPSFLN